MSFWSNITTGKDNKTHDGVKTAIVVMTGIFPFLVVWGMVMVSCSFFLGKVFDLMQAYEAFSLIIVAFGTYLAQGAGAVYMKRVTEPDGAVTETESITSGKQPDVKPVVQNITNVITPSGENM